MAFFTEYETGLIGKLTLASDGENIIGCWFENDRLFGDTVDEPLAANDKLPVFEKAKAWLDRYFKGENPDIGELPLKPNGTEFRHLVWDKLKAIPYGTTTTYGEIARQLELQTGRRVSSQAVGGAVGHNPLCVIVPCHRVMGAKGNLTGFSGGIDTKVKLLEHEHVNMATFFRPEKGTAL
ncbi:methylated-DNA--[protein]-cysteine S-methyltransferase [Rubneribacter sp.]|nr:methylated-DNA--[protein]-cysteine S-methyltransferase [Candidatus Rubneribacter avistercoris]